MNRYLPILCTLAISLWSVQPTGAETRKVCNDFDGDNKTDVAVYYPASGQWWVLLMGSRTVTNVTTWHGPNYLPAPGDYDGDHKTDFVVFDSNTGNWYAKLSNGVEGMANFGRGMWPVPADYDGDRVTDLGVYDPLTGIWSLYSLRKGWLDSGKFGYLGDIHVLGPQAYTVLPMPFDYNQDGVDDPGYYYRGTSMKDSGWSILYVGTGISEDYIWGSSGSLPVPGKYEAKTNATPYYAYGLCVYKILDPGNPAKSAEWSIPHRAAFYMGVYGETLPVSAGDYDGNGFDDNAAYNYVTGEWTIIYNTGGLPVVGREQIGGGFGGPGFVPANIYSTIYALARYSPKPW